MAEWFEPKKYGWGSGLPVTWQGWLVMLIYLLVVIGSAVLLEDNPWAIGSVMVTATAIFLVIAARTTRGGWRWRWGDKE